MKISEPVFASIQGEGPQAGLPSVFVRTSGCNLRCNFCDSKFSWKESKTMRVERIAKKVKEYKNIDNVVITGGEPLLQKQQIEKLMQCLPKHFFEIETNGTILPLEIPWSKRSDIGFIVSPKLDNLNLTVLKEYTKMYADFKFVVENKKDLETITDIVKKLKIQPYSVFLMPEGTDDKEIKKKAKWIVEYCKKTGYRFSPRLHVWVWGKKRGV